MCSVVAVDIHEPLALVWIAHQAPQRRRKPRSRRHGVNAAGRPRCAAPHRLAPLWACSLHNFCVL
jgi:hypothetical protein